MAMSRDLAKAFKWSSFDNDGGETECTDHCGNLDFDATNFNPPPSVHLAHCALFVLKYVYSAR